MSLRRVVRFLGAMAMAGAGHVAMAQERPAPRPKQALEFAMSAYAGGDHGVVERLFTRSLDFQAEGLLNRRKLERWLGTWDRQKALFVLELANRSSHVAPVYSIPLLTAGRQYLEKRTTPAGDDTFDRLWHQSAVGILQRRYLAAVEDYIAAVEKSRMGSDAALRARFAFARAVSHEQRCWLERPVLMRVGTPVNELNRVSGGSARGAPVRLPGTIAPDVGRRLDCLAMTAGLYAKAAAAGDAATEARIRLAWVQFQLGMFSEAQTSLDAADPGTDRDLQYWTTLFRARLAGVMKRPADAERAYRQALAIHPEAQTAGVGLALTLYEMDRLDEANDAARSVRTSTESAVDPWWTYLAADSRFVDGWIGRLRALQ